MTDTFPQSPGSVDALRRKISSMDLPPGVPDPYALTSWGNSGPSTRDLVLPSGQRCLIRKLEMEDILQLGIMDVIDTFTGNLLSSTEKKKKKSRPEGDGMEMIKLLADKDNFARMNEAVNKVVVASVLKPEIHPVPEGDLQDGLIYVDSIEFADRMEIFNASFDSLGDMSTFREGQDGDLGDLAAK